MFFPAKYESSWVLVALQQHLQANELLIIGPAQLISFVKSVLI